MLTSESFSLLVDFFMVATLGPSLPSHGIALTHIHQGGASGFGQEKGLRRLSPSQLLSYSNPLLDDRHNEQGKDTHGHLSLLSKLPSFSASSPTSSYYTVTRIARIQHSYSSLALLLLLLPPQWRIGSAASTLPPIVYMALDRSGPRYHFANSYRNQLQQFRRLRYTRDHPN